jgi:hypothetical protein
MNLIQKSSWVLVWAWVGLIFPLHAQPKLTLQQAEQLAKLPLSCLQKEFPYKTGVVLDERLAKQNPREYHPVFYGCFDWHSAAHGYWSLVRLLKLFPELSAKDSIFSIFDRAFTASNLSRELELFASQSNRSFERPYGWAWFLQLQTELLGWQEPKAQEWRQALEPLAAHIRAQTADFLTKIVYPIRAGEHSNLAFGLKLIFDHAKAVNDSRLMQLIQNKAFEFYLNDKDCPLAWEPGGYDFLSPCLEEADLLRRLMTQQDFEKWLKDFLPLQNLKKLTPAQVLDGTDGKLVHLDGLNLSRSACLWAIGDKTQNRKWYYQLAETHFKAGWEKTFSGDYAAEHWLASFAIYSVTGCGR